MSRPESWFQKQIPHQRILRSEAAPNDARIRASSPNDAPLVRMPAFRARLRQGEQRMTALYAGLGATPRSAAAAIAYGGRV